MSNLPAEIETKIEAIIISLNSASGALDAMDIEAVNDDLYTACCLIISIIGDKEIKLTPAHRKAALKAIKEFEKQL